VKTSFTSDPQLWYDESEKVNYKRLFRFKVNDDDYILEKDQSGSEARIKHICGIPMLQKFSPEELRLRTVYPHVEPGGNSIVGN
jgi:hypothetical protein